MNLKRALLKILYQYMQITNTVLPKHETLAIQNLRTILKDYTK